MQEPWGKQTVRTTNHVEILALLLAEAEVGVGVSWLKLDEAVFYGMCFAMSFASASFTLINDSGGKHLWKCITAGFVSGFLGLSIISMWVGRVDQPLSHHWHWIGLALLIGLSAKHGEIIREKALAVVMSGFGAVFNQGRKRNDDGEPDA